MSIASNWSRKSEISSVSRVLAKACSWFHSTQSQGRAGNSLHITIRGTIHQQSPSQDTLSHTLEKTWWSYFWQRLYWRPDKHIGPGVAFKVKGYGLWPTRRAICFRRLYFTNSRMFERTEISNGMSDASPPSLAHGCAAQYVQTHFLRSRLHKQYST